MKKLAIIPARGGSKRIPKKNIKLFCGQPIIAYSIQVAKESGLFDSIIVSTDDENIARIAREYGAKTPFMRPSELSDDFTGTGAVTAHALEYFKSQNENFDFCCTIYATAPFLQANTLKQSFNELIASQAKYCFGATSYPYPIWRSFSVNENKRCEMFFKENFDKRSQDLQDAYHDAGQFYWDNLKLNSDKNIFQGDSIAHILPRTAVQDIDTKEDWDMAELLYKAILRQSSNRFL